MKASKETNPRESAADSNAAIKTGSRGEEFDEPIYKCDALGTVAGMLKRILTIFLGMVAGSLIALGVIHLSGLLGWGRDREIDEWTAYIGEVFRMVEKNYVEEGLTKPEDLTAAALDGMLSGLDPHSQFMRASDYTQLQEDLDSEFGGIGVQIERRDGQVVVIAPIAGTPGERAGILRGDWVVEVDGESMRGKSIDRVVSKMRGKPGTSVDVAFERTGSDEPIQFTLIREKIRVESVTDVSMVRDGIGYLRLTQFAEPTAEELRVALEKLEAEGMKALVLDVRNNPGGLLSSVAAVLEPFFDNGELLVYTQGRNPADRDEYRSENTQTPKSWPIAVLINAGSASAAEILAGSLKDAGKAVLVGERSFGKGSVQSIIRLREGEAMRLTTARYYTPSGVTIHERGIEPHVQVIMTPAEDGNVALQRARNDITDPAEFEARFSMAPVADRQLDAALAILQAAMISDERKLVDR
jgi:carboxyl-terminal processing protease